MELKKILQGLDKIKAKGNLEIDIKNITNDSRKVEKGTMFIAIKGFEVDGHKFIENAIEKGAVCVMLEEGADLSNLKDAENVTILVVPNTRIAQAVCTANFYDNPAKKLRLIGVTGTKGKTTTTYMIKEMLEASGKKVRTNWNNCCIHKWKKT